MWLQTFFDLQNETPNPLILYFHLVLCLGDLQSAWRAGIVRSIIVFILLYFSALIQFLFSLHPLYAIYYLLFLEKYCKITVKLFRIGQTVQRAVIWEILKHHERHEFVDKATPISTIINHYLGFVVYKTCTYQFVALWPVSQDTIFITCPSKLACLYTQQQMRCSCQLWHYWLSS